MNTEFLDVSVYDLRDNFEAIYRWYPMKNKADKIRQYMLRNWCDDEDKYKQNTISYSHKLLVYHKKISGETEVFEKFVPVGSTYHVMFEALDSQVEAAYERRHSIRGLLS